MIPSVMPEFNRGTHAFHHTLASALSSLASAGIPSSRITVQMAGFGYPTNWVVEQSPAAGSPIGPGDRITLAVAGASFFSYLPVGMWDRGDEKTPGTAELLQPLDDPLQKAAGWLNEGARLLDIQPARRPDCARWISLFGLSPEAWPPELWYPLAVLLPSLQSLAGTEVGIRFAVQLLLNLPVLALASKRGVAFLHASTHTLLGSRDSRLGVDSIVGDRIEDLGDFHLTLGFVDLETFYAFQTGERTRLLDLVLGLVIPFDRRLRLSWRVHNPELAPVLGRAAQNCVLSVNSYLGRPRPHPNEQAA